MGDVTPTSFDIKESKSKVQEYTGKITDNPAPPDEKYEEPIFAKEPPSSEIFGDIPINIENRELQEIHRAVLNEPIDGYKRNVLWIIFLGALVLILRINIYIILKLFFFFGGFLLKRYDSQSNTTIRPPERPAAGAGGSSTNPPPVNRGRRHIRTTIFENECNEYGLSNGPAAGLGPQFETPSDNNNQGIFSIKGTRSIKIYRHRDTVNVFPSGCMGIPQDALPKIPEDQTPNTSPIKKDTDSAASTPRSMDDGTPRDDITPRDPRDPRVDVVYSPPNKKNEDLVGVYSGEESPVLTPRSVTQNCSINSVQYRRSRPLSAIQRNPLTGVGYEDRDFIRQSTMKKRDGNPVLGQGYDTKDLSNKSKKIPPGGYSRGLW